MSDDTDRWIDMEEASHLLEVAPEQFQQLIEQGLLTVSGDHHAPMFLRAEVMALRELGG